MSTVSESLNNQIFNWADVVQSSLNLSDNATVFTLTGMIFAAGFVLFYIARPILLAVIARIASREKSVWMKAAYQNNVFNRIAMLIPGFVVLITTPVISNARMPLAKVFAHTLEMGGKIYLVLVSASIISALLNTAEKRFSSLKMARKFSIKSYLQVIRLILLLLTGIIVVSIIIGKSPMYLLTGLGAMTAVGMLVFKDTILGLAASIQFAANDIIRVGDWVEIPKMGIDGTVIDISLSTIKIKNFNNTVSTIPSYSILNDNVTNWRAMSESGGRRIKRSLTINIKSVKLLSSEQIERFAQLPLLKDKIANHLASDNRHIDNDALNMINADQRCLSNLMLFRMYLEAYLSSHPKVHHDMSFLIRELQHTNYGIPLELYIFLNIVEWNTYESIQADIFDYIYSVALPLFELEAFQYKAADPVTKQSSEVAA